MLGAGIRVLAEQGRSPDEISGVRFLKANYSFLGTSHGRRNQAPGESWWGLWDLVSMGPWRSSQVLSRP